MWLSSGEHRSWETPRLVRPRRLVTGPSEERQYLWLSVEALDHVPADGEWAVSDVVVTPRFTYSVEAPAIGRPVHVHLWVTEDRAGLEGGRFTPRSPHPDSWCTLYATREEAAGTGVPS